MVLLVQTVPKPDILPSGLRPEAQTELYPYPWSMIQV